MVFIVKYKVNPFLVLIMACLFLGLSTGMTPMKVVASVTAGMSSTLGFISIVIGFGTMIGKLMGESGAAEVIAKRMINIFGEKNLDWAMMCVAFIIGISVFFQVGVVLLIPLLFTLCLRTGVSLITISVPLIATLSTLHHYVPPHPAAMAVVQLFHADLAKSLIYGLIVSIPCAIIGGPIYGRYIGNKMNIKPPAEMVEKFCGKAKTHDNPPSFAVAVFTMLFPIGLMLLSKVADLFLVKGSLIYEVFKFVGDGSMALLFALLLTLYTFGYSRGFTKEQLQKFTTECLGPVAMILLVIGAGGAFGNILVSSGVAKAVAAAAASVNMPPLLFGWLLGAIIRISVGSATVAMMTAGGLVLPLVAPGAGTSPELMLMAIGAGACALSHVNDSGFWLVKECFGMTVEQTLKTWSVAITIVSFVGLAIVMIMSALGM
ncbi:MAG: gluconate:H+ symporter [Negativicutes bacterium]|nr:gluconate:H+ symporter [Negativicutes bacterium]